METFHLLSRGGTKFDKKRFSKDVKLFNASSVSADSASSSTKTSKALAALTTGELPAELDFFKYAAGGSATQSAASKKGKAKAKDDEDEEMEGDTTTNATDSIPRKRKQSDSEAAGMPIRSFFDSCF